MTRIENGTVYLYKETPEIVATAASVYKPGNLVWGCRHVDPKKWASFVEKGICRERDIIEKEDPKHPSLAAISFSMLSELPYPQNYDCALDYGPKTQFYYYSEWETPLSIIINRQKILKAYPNQIHAVGEDFFSPQVTRRRFGVTDNTASGIPLQRPYRGSPIPLSDEARLYPINYPESDEPIEGIVPQFWEGIVVPPQGFENLQAWSLEQEIRLKIPVFNNYEGQFLAHQIG